MNRIPLGKLAEKLNQFILKERGYLRWDQYWFLKGCSKELHKAAIYYDEQTECTKNILNKMQKKRSE